MGAVEEMMCVVCVMLQRGHSGDGCILASTLCFLALESMLCVCVEDVMDVVFSVCIVRRGAVSASAWGV